MVALTRLFVCLFLMLPPLPLAAQTQTQTQTRAGAQMLKLVPQSVGIGAFDAAAWLPDGRFLLTASGHERLIRIWDINEAVIVDTIRLPMPGKRADEKLVLDRVTVSPDGRQARVEGVLAAENEAIGDMKHAATAHAVDLVARRASIVPATHDIENPEQPIPGEGEVPDQDAGKPVLPPAPDGRRLQRTDAGTLLVLDASGEELAELSGEEPVETSWASVSPDGAMVVFLSPQPQPEATGTAPGAKRQTEDGEEPYDGPITRLVIFSTETGRSSQYAEPWDNYGNYGRVGWTGDGRMLLSEESSAYHREGRYYPEARGEPAAGWLMDLTGAREPVEIEPGCYLQPLGRDRLISAGNSNCRHKVKRDPKIWVRPLEGDWVELPVQLPRGATVDGLRASPDGRRVAISFGRKGEALAVIVVDSTTAETIAELGLEGPMITAFDFLPDSRSLVVLGSRVSMHWRFEEDRVDEVPDTDFDPSMIVSDGRDLLFGAAGSPSVQRLRLGSSQPAATLDVLAPIAGGFLAGNTLLWVGTASGELKLFDRRDWTLLATMERFRNGEEEYFIVHDPAGRYDSNLPPDYAPFRWLVMDAPFQSLAPQTFMRELYTPDLLARLLQCAPTRSCDKALPLALDVARLNRTLPVVETLVVTQGVAPGTVDVAVTVREGVSNLPSAAYGQARSGMHNLRLFRDGVLVAEAGAADPALDRGDREAWRRATRLAPNGPDGVHVALFPGVRLPSGPREDPVLFSAYAFNEDRVRGEEATQEVPLPASATAPRPRRLFLVSIGVDAYPGGLFRPLRYAVADAQAMAELFTGAFVHPADGRPVTVVRIRIEGTAGQPATRAQIEGAFERLHTATPDDLVVISFSGHGYTDASGRFALVPSDVRTVGDRPVWESMIGADDLARWLTPVDAGHIHLVIDACHSAASVQSGGFKPGPMGDPGLGQLAYDKGIRILSASAPDQYAMEDTRLGHGLLTYALVVEGARQGKADTDDDKVVTFDELMAYAVNRLPAMRDPTDPAEGPGLVVEWAGPPVARQTPKLFDFHPSQSPMAVRPDMAGLTPAMERARGRP
jgi:hypothetical protein